MAQPATCQDGSTKTARNQPYAVCSRLNSGRRAPATAHRRTKARTKRAFDETQVVIAGAGSQARKNLLFRGLLSLLASLLLGLALGLLDVVFGSAATLIGALWCRKFAENPKLAMLGPVLANAIIVPAYLPILLQGLGFYTIPFTTISLDGAYLPMYLFGLIATGIGEAAVIYILGTPLLAALRRAKVFAK